MSRARRILGGIGYGYVNTAVVMIVGLWMMPFLLRHLGSEELGLWFTAQGLIGYVLLLDLGVVALLPRETAALTGRPEHETGHALHDLVGQTMRLVLWQTPLVAIAALLVWLLMPEAWAPLRWPAALMLITFVAFFPMRVLHGLLFGLQDLVYVGRLQLFAWALNTVTTIVLVTLGYGLYALAFGWVALQLVLALGWWLRARMQFRSALPRSLPALKWSFVRMHMGKSMWVSVAQVAQVFLSGSDILVIGYVLGPAAVVPYAFTGKLVSVLANQPQMIMQSAAPALAQVRTAESPERLASASSALAQAMLLVTGAVACVIAAVNGAFVDWWVGPSQYAGMKLTLVLLLVMLLRHWNTTTVYALFTRGFERHLSLVTLGDGLVTVAAAATCVRFLGPIGAPLGSIIGATCVSLPLNLRALGRVNGSSLWRVASGLVPWALRFVLVLAGAVVAGMTWRPAAPAGIALLAAGTALTYVLVAGPVALRDPLGAYVRPWLPPWFAWR